VSTQPETTPTDDAAYEAHLHAGELRLQQCASCATLRHPPAWLCPACLDDAYSWVPISGSGQIFSFVVTAKGEIPAVVTLTEGPRLVTSLVGTDPAAARIGLPVRVAVEEIVNGSPLPYARPVDDPRSVGMTKEETA
jgi:hypothetical protein